MSVSSCHFCGATVDRASTHCPGCGSFMDPGAPAAHHGASHLVFGTVGIVIALGLCVLIGIVVAVFLALM